MVSIGAKINFYSCTSTDSRNQIKVLCRYFHEDKMLRVRPQDHLKADGSLLVGFAEKVGEFLLKWFNELNGKKRPTVK